MLFREEAAEGYVGGCDRATLREVIAACLLHILFTNVGLPSTSFSVFQPYLVTSSGVGSTGGSMRHLGAHVHVADYLVVGRCTACSALPHRRVSPIAVRLRGASSSIRRTREASSVCAPRLGVHGAWGTAGGMMASTMLIDRWFRSNVATVGIGGRVGSGCRHLAGRDGCARIRTRFPAAFLFESALALVLRVLVFLLLRNLRATWGFRPYEAPEGDLLFNTLQKLQIPTIIFINKIDRDGVCEFRAFCIWI